MLTFVVPTFNEPEDVLTSSLRALVGAKRPSPRFEILVVDDSDPDHEPQIAAAIHRAAAHVGRDGTIRMLRGPRRGKGAAIRLGALVSNGDVVFLVDADLPVPLQHVAQFAALLADGADVVIAERPLSRHKDPFRRLLSRGLLLIQSAIVFHSLLFKDTQCGFKAFRGGVLRALASRQIVERGMYDLEYLYMAAQAELVVVRIPVVPTPEVRESRIDAWRCLRQDPFDILHVKMLGLARRLRGARIVVAQPEFANDGPELRDARDAAPPEDVQSSGASAPKANGTGHEGLHAK